MTRLIASLAEIAAGYDALYCDLWGCLHDGRRPFPGAVEALEAFRRGGGRVALVTNAPRPAHVVEAQLDAMGVPRGAWDAVVSSGDAAQVAMLEGAAGRRVHHVGPEKDESFFADLPPEAAGLPPVERVPLAEAEGIVVTGLLDDLVQTPEDYRAELTEAAARGLPLLCANPDIVVDFGDRRLYCAGALAELYEGLGGRAVYVGKPHAPIYALAARRLGLGTQARVLAVGDGIDTDVLGAERQGLDALFVTGGLAHDQFGPDRAAPDPGLLDAWLAARGRAPRFAIASLT